MWNPFKKEQSKANTNFSRSFKLDFSAGGSVLMYLYPDGHLEFIWAPVPPFSAEKTKEIDAKFLNWIKTVLGK